MVFSSIEFLFVFLPVVLLLYFNPLTRSRTYRNVILLAASLFFYAWGEPVFVFLMILSIIMTWLVGVKMDAAAPNRKKPWLTLGMGLHVLLLVVFKYLTFLCQQLGLLLHMDTGAIDIALPIGISFFTFQLMSYLFDVYYGESAVQKNVFWLGLYVSLFPQLIAGPIVRYEQIADEILHRKETRADFAEGMTRFIFGLAKKLLLANYMAQIADNTFLLSSLLPISVASAWLGAVAYALQIYFDFSGYSDMAIGLGRMFGFHFAENFNYPYVANSITDFWRRWHISLSSWFRDYVYIPLGGNRVSRRRQIFNIFVVWALTGIWHGANWTFVAWGLFYFVLLMAEKTFGFAKKLGIFSHLYVWLMLLLGWVLFRAESIGAALRYMGQMFGRVTAGFTDETFFTYLSSCKYVLPVALFFCLPVYPFIKRHLPALLADLVTAVVLLAAAALSLLSVVGTTYNPFIYFNF